jgi:cytochrome c biogenesis protein CcdA/thiol-disulfide isomerase/thioredoxin
MFLLFGSFIAGMLTVLAPCVLALLPIIVGGSVQGDVRDKKRPLVIAASLAISIFVFTLLLKASSLLVDIDPRTITYVSGSIIVIVGLLTLFPGIYAKALIRLGVEHRAVGLLGKSNQNKRGLVGPIITGAALGPVFSSCSPVYAYILATVLPVNFAQAMAYIVAYILGLAIVLLLIGYYGQRFISRIKFASDPKGMFQRAIAILFIVVGLLVFTGYDKKFQTYVSEHTPFNFDKLSSQLLPGSQNKVSGDGVLNVEPYPAAEFKGLDGWINSKPLTLQELRGKVVLVDFWTYSCINCIRNNPYLDKWHQTYKDQGLVVVGVHAPEFAFEKERANVLKAVKDQRISYPVALDNDFSTWNAFDNRSWPSAYLIDADGNVRRIHEGEGQYAETEQAIRDLLTEKGARLVGVGMTSGDTKPPVTADQTPETYLGSARASNYSGSPALAAAPIATFTPDGQLGANEWTLGGTWEVQQQKIIARGGSTLRIKVSAKNMYLVGGASNTSTRQQIGVMLDGKPISATDAAGDDVRDSMVGVQESKLYRLVSFGDFTKDKEVTLTVPDGVELNVFTFGS